MHVRMTRVLTRPDELIKANVSSAISSGNQSWTTDHVVRRQVVFQTPSRDTRDFTVHEVRHDHDIHTACNIRAACEMAKTRPFQWAYAGLWLIRIWFALCGTGYIHPDEHMQNGEVTAGTLLFGSNTTLLTGARKAISSVYML